MQTPATEIDQMIVELNEFILPSSLMESFDVYREESVRDAARNFSDQQLSWFLDMLNRFRGSDDRKDSLVDIFDRYVHLRSSGVGGCTGNSDRDAGADVRSGETRRSQFGIR